MKQTSEDIINFYDFRETLGVEIVYGKQVKHNFSRHTHRTLCIGIVEKGVRVLLCRGERYQLTPGMVFIIPPNEAHSCLSENRPHTYRLFLPSLEIQTMIMPNNIYTFNHLIINDNRWFNNLLSLHAVLMSEEPDFFKQSVLISTLDEIVKYSTDSDNDLKITSKQSDSVRQVRELIETRYDQRFSLGEIAKETFLSPYYLIRVFNHIVGVPPHTYFQQVRIRHAKEMLVRGSPIIDVAIKTGFTDQSHFANTFKKMVGVTPGVYIKSYRVSSRKTPEETPNNN